MFEAIGCFYHYCPFQETRPTLIEEDIERGLKKREMDQLRKQYIKEEGYIMLLKCGNVSRGICIK